MFVTISFTLPTLIIIAASSYLLGSIPFGYLLVRLFRGEDVRLSGSGNIGATNVSRKSPMLGVVTLIFDALKGAAAVTLAFRLCSSTSSSTRISVASLAALCAVAGHIFPIWLKFRGGKGVATGLGSFLLIAPKAVVIAAGIFVAVLFIFRYVSLASMIAVGCFPLIVFAMHMYGDAPPALAFIAATSLLIIARHYANIRRLVAGTECRFGVRRP